jgi:hypothetical protein
MSANRKAAAPSRDIVERRALSSTSVDRLDRAALVLLPHADVV